MYLNNEIAQNLESGKNSFLIFPKIKNKWLNTKNFPHNFYLKRLIFNHIILVTFPPVVFFTFFFYTDNGSLLTILTFLLLTFKERSLSSCLFGIIALFFRQTSLIWIFFATCISILYQKSRLGQTIRTVDKDLLATGLNPFLRYNWDQVGSNIHS